LIEGLDDDTVKELEEQAKENNRSLEEEIKAILEEEAERLVPDSGHIHRPR